MGAEDLLGKESAEVIAFICKSHPDIKSLTVGGYDCLIDRGSHGRHLYLQGISDIPRARFLTPGWVTELPREKSELQTDYLAICSRVVMADGTIRHIPMHDFDSYWYDDEYKWDEDTREFDKDVKTLTKELRHLRRPPGFILDSGHGLHYYGLRLFKDEYFRQHLNNMRRRGWEYDHNWLEYAKDSGFFALRVNQGPFKIRIPTVLTLFGNR